MTDSTGTNARTGAPLSDWEHVQQSIECILTTPIGSRVMRRDFGSALPDLIDAKMVQRNVLALYVATAVAIDRWEPRYRLNHTALDRMGPDGVISLVLRGTYYPRGHLGDYSIAEDRTARIVIEGGIS